ncbi:MAG: Gfo/Idh/MocA family oxidoreductase [Bacteroidales bacterium]|nr:Gfo/Idh/MocA family oxidoreductase [Bacteroidales bacterium]MCB9013893.1 Gfo/Idh/MocA family oxidoreductase [Bacteroidales bacterium]
MRRIKWGVLAPGRIARGFVNGLKVLENAELYAVGSRDYNRAVSFAQEFGFQKAYGSYEELAKDPDVDVIYVASPHHLHFENTLMCLENDKAVLCEKPFTINSRQLEILVRTAREKRIFLMEALWSRFLPGLQEAKRLIDSGAIGKVKILNADFGFKAPYDPNSRLFNPVLGGGSLLDIGIYPVFLSLYFLGYPDEIKAQAIKAPTGVDESISISFLYNSGALANIHSTFAANTNTDANIYGDKGKIHIQRQWFRPSTVLLSQENETVQKLEFPARANGYEYEAEEVMRCLDEGKEESDAMSLDMSLQLMKLLDAIRSMCSIVYTDYD